MWYSVAMDKNTCTIYEGDCFTAEWFYDDDGGSQSYDYFLKASDVEKRRFLILVKRLCDFGRIADKTKFRNEDNGIYAFKPQPDRYLCFFFIGKKVIVTNAYRKKGQKLPKSEKRNRIEEQGYI